MTASIRRQLVRIVEGRKEGGYGDAFEVVCCDCGDHCEVPELVQTV